MRYTLPMRSTAGLAMGSAFVAAVGLACVVLVALGTGERGTHVALQVSARLSFLLFWPAYAAGALHTLFGTSFYHLKQRAREFGLAFASAHLVHIGLVAWLCHIGAAPSFRTFVFFGIAVLWIYLIALFSIPRLQSTLGRRGWWLLRVVGLNYIAYAFAVDFLRYIQLDSPKYLLAYFPFAVFSILGPLLLLAAWVQRTASSIKRAG
jgi:hypothetical protein